MFYPLKFMVPGTINSGIPVHTEFFGSLGLALWIALQSTQANKCLSPSRTEPPLMDKKKTLDYFPP